MKHRRNLGVDKPERTICELPEKKKIWRKKAERNKSPRTKQFPGRSGRWLFLLLDSHAELVLCRCGRRGKVPERVEAVKKELIRMQ